MSLSPRLNASPAEGSKRPWTLKEVTAAGLFAALTAVGAYVTLPMPWVPFTLQVLVTLLAGVVLGARAGALSQGVYVLMGVAGLPVFAGRIGGIQALVGPTGGYILGFVVAAWLVGRVMERDQARRPLRAMAAMGLGIAAIHICGVLVLSFHVGSLERAVAIGLAFLPVDVLKAIAAYTIAKGLAARGITLHERP